MDAWGIGIFTIGLILYFVVKKNNDGLARFILFISGAGFGVAVGAIIAYVMFGSMFG